ncbi:glycoside hydrolase family 78 protein [Amycolatopsis thermalba]|uniref:alpha-L-rhamnosidase n=1 Tax=Amycolatopsis thermalba TaxID=944492 RepID=A0ABY4P0K1_9PSEU|nr:MULTISPECIES: family 78 glycoside hydrolase catalytic domain [Amycolatopsis]UQS25864.1 glycoside hydrolase family 78 protein [Amycolatopsis thermalba]
MNQPAELRLEHLPPGQPCGVPRPRLSWWLPENAAVQHAYAVRIVHDGRVSWESGRRADGRSVLVDAGVPAGVPGSEWQVRVWTDLGESGWSAPAPWTVTAPDFGTAQWIEPAEDAVPPPGRRPVYNLHTECTLGAAVVQATAWATAHGVYELFINGVRVGDQELTPGFTAYRSRLQAQRYDVAGHLREGVNTVDILLSDGWFRGRHGFERTADGFGTRVAALLALGATLADGTGATVVTGDGWRSRPSGMTADLMDGQTRGPATAEWAAARPVRGGLYDDRSRLELSVAPPVRRAAELAPVSVRRAGGSQVIDFGRNLNGWVRLTAPPGRITLTHGEFLGPDGRVDTGHLRAFDFATRQPLPAGQVDVVEGGGVFEPRHTTHGFRYVQIDGRAEDVTAVVVHTDLRRTGWFRCGDEDLNALHEAATRSFLANACDLPTDCPQRERSGFTGDWQVYAGAAAFTHDVAGFSDKWLRDLAADQLPDGRVTTIAPKPSGGTAMDGSAGWGDASVIVPWEMWRAYGDLELLRRQFGSMRRWVGFAARTARENRHPDRRGAPAPHEEYLWDTGFHFGEWLEPGETPAPDPGEDHGIVATAYLARSADLLSRIATLLGEDADGYRRIAAGAREAWQREYLAADGSIAVPTQANHVRALAFGLVPSSLRAAVAARLVSLVERAGYRVGTGFLSTGLLLPVLADAGYVDEAYRVLLARGVPSWLGMLDRGATTIWEYWDGVDAGRARGSLNHYGKGAVISFLHTHVAGIRLPDDPGAAEAGYRRFVVQPCPGGGLRWAEAEHHSPYGVIRSAWRVGGGRMWLSVTVPPGTRARIRLPDKEIGDAGPGAHEWRVELPR